jgi:hypothetical protein
MSSYLPEEPAKTFATEKCGAEAGSERLEALIKCPMLTP